MNKFYFALSLVTFFCVGAVNSANLATAPVANNDAVVVYNGSILNVDVLANDVDANNDIDYSSINIVDNTINGTVKIIKTVSGNRISYTANNNFIGADSFNYTVKDLAGNTSAIATVTLNVKETIVLPYSIEVDAQHPKQDMRASFITTAYGIDWPKTTSVKYQKRDLDRFIRYGYEGNSNAILFQVRPAGDVYYKSNIEPWSKLLTGTQGKEPKFDPLQFAIDSCHALGMELHAWVNPYRTSYGSKPNVLDPKHVEITHPEWIMVNIEHGKENRILNPGIPEVRAYVVSIVAEIIENYDVDGIHFDDYFYSHNSTDDALDEEQYQAYNPNNLDRGDWRRDNINQLVKDVNDKIQEVNNAKGKNVIFGISPAGIWKNNEPEGIAGNQSYFASYGDGVAWLNNQDVDYLAPQVYWRIRNNGTTDYKALINWWNDKAASAGRYLMSSNALYKLKEGWPAVEIENQIKVNRDARNKNTLGQLFYAANNYTSPLDYDGTKSIHTLLKNDVYKNPSISPSYFWKEQIVPNAPKSLIQNLNKLTWGKPDVATDGDTARRYIVYMFKTIEERIVNKHNSNNIVAITGKTSIALPYDVMNGEEFYFAVTAVDKNNNESDFTDLIQVLPNPVYCSAKGLNSTNEWIEEITIGGIKNTSGNNNGYADFTDKIVNVSTVGITSIKLMPGYKTVKANQHWKIFIDYNNNGSFADAKEQVFATTTANTDAVIGVIKKPTAVLDGLVRMRIIMKGTDADNDIDACTDVENGEVEDYMVKFVADPLSVNNDNNIISASVFPNPFANKFKVTFQSNKKQNIQLVAYDMLGQVVYHRTMTSTSGVNNFDIDTSAWSNGAYMLLVKDENSKKKVLKLIKE